MLINNSKELNNIPQEIKKFSFTSRPFNPLCLSFLKEISSELKKINFTKDTSGLAALAFWLREKNLINLNDYFKNSLKNRFSIGVVFHITPANTPLTFFYSYLFGLVSGNINIVRLPNKNFLEVNILIEIIIKIFKKKKYREIQSKTFLINYDKKSNFTKLFSSICDVRIIWGGNETINNIRQIPIPAKSREITFSDKYSSCIINSEKIVNLNKNELMRFIHNFYNDGFFMDQNACSSPHLIFWQGSKNNLARKIFWKELELYSKKKYDLPQIGSVDKLTQYYEDLINLKIKKNININNFCYNLLLKELPKDISTLRASWGYFYEYEIKKLNDLNEIITNNFQTLTYFGFDNKKLADNIIVNPANGVDRIVPIGSAHLMDQFWDGYDIISTLTRVVNSY